MDMGLRSKLYFRTVIFFSSLLLYIFNAPLLASLMNFGYGIKVYHLLWLYLMYEIALKVVSNLNHHVASGKHLYKHYEPVPCDDLEKLKKYTQKMNLGAYKSAGFWLFCNLCIFTVLLYFPNKTHHVFLLFLFYYMCDMWCANVFCVFQALFMHNRCCTVCRIYNYDQFMYLMPFLLIPSFYTYSLVAFSLFALLQWEYLHHKHPERFSSLTNLNLRCTHCKDKRCHKLLTMPSRFRKIG